MKSKRLWAGVDLGVDSACICIVDQSGQVQHEAVCNSSAKALRRELRCFRRTRFEGVVFEAGMLTHVARDLRAFGYPVELYEARRLSKFLRVQRNKTDAGDARGIAEAGRIGAPLVTRVYLKSQSSQSLQSCLTIRRHLIRQRVAAANLLCRQIEQFGGRLRCRTHSVSFGPQAHGELTRIFGKSEESEVIELRELANLCAHLIDHQLALDRKLKNLAQKNEVCRRFMEIPGIGYLCALTFYAYVDDPHRFSRNCKIGDYFGLAPRLHESGLTLRRPRISKMGNRSVRALLVHAAAMHLRYCSPDSQLRDWTMRIEARRARLPSRVALARKLAVVMLSLWKSGENFREDLVSEAPSSDEGYAGFTAMV